MSNEKINRALHSAIGRGSDWHELEEYTIADEYLNCAHCDVTVMEHIENNPDYSSDLNAVAEAEKFVIEKAGKAAYGLALLQEIYDSFAPNVLELYGVPDDWAIVATATAEQRAKACLAALGVSYE